MLIYFPFSIRPVGIAMPRNSTQLDHNALFLYGHRHVSHQIVIQPYRHEMTRYPRRPQPRNDASAYVLA